MVMTRTAASMHFYTIHACTRTWAMELFCGQDCRMCQKKNDTHLETTFVTVPLCHYKRSSRRHKCSSRRSISKAGPCFWKLCVYEPSAPLKMPSDLRHKCTFGKLFGHWCHFLTCAVEQWCMRCSYFTTFIFSYSICNPDPALMLFARDSILCVCVRAMSCAEFSEDIVREVRATETSEERTVMNYTNANITVIAWTRCLHTELLIGARFTQTQNRVYILLKDVKQTKLLVRV